MDFLPKGISDHSHVLVHVFSPRASPTSSFRFKNHLAEDAVFLPLIEHCLRELVVGCAMFRLVQLLKKVKVHLKKLDRDEYKQLDDQIFYAQHKLDVARKNLQICLLMSPFKYLLRML